VNLVHIAGKNTAPESVYSMIDAMPGVAQGPLTYFADNYGPDSEFGDGYTADAVVKWVDKHQPDGSIPILLDMEKDNGLYWRAKHVPNVKIKELTMRRMVVIDAMQEAAPGVEVYVYNSPYWHMGLKTYTLGHELAEAAGGTAQGLYGDFAFQAERSDEAGQMPFPFMSLIMPEWWATTEDGVKRWYAIDVKTWKQHAGNSASSFATHRVLWSTAHLNDHNHSYLGNPTSDFMQAFWTWYPAVVKAEQEVSS